MLTQTLRSLFAVAEAYPDLKANQNFLELQNELSDIEEKIAYARQFYNTQRAVLQREDADVPDGDLRQHVQLRAGGVLRGGGGERAGCARLASTRRRRHRLAATAGRRLVANGRRLSRYRDGQDRVLIYDRIGTNKRQTWLMMFALRRAHRRRSRRVDRVLDRRIVAGAAVRLRRPHPLVRRSATTPARASRSASAARSR